MFSTHILYFHIKKRFCLKKKEKDKIQRTEVNLIY